MTSLNLSTSTTSSRKRTREEFDDDKQDLRSGYYNNRSINASVNSNNSICTMIKFGDGVAYQINDAGLIRKLQARFFKLCYPMDQDRDLNRRNSRTFPGCMPVALTRANLHYLKSRNLLENKCDSKHRIFNGANINKFDTDIKSSSNNIGNDSSSSSSRTYYVTRKSNGIRHFLMFDYENYDDSTGAYQVLWDRTMKPLLVKFSVPDYIHQDTLIDGELVEEPDGSFSFYCIDLLSVNGRSTINYRLHERQRLINELVKNINSVEDTNETPFTIRCKRFMPAYQLLEFLQLENIFTEELKKLLDADKSNANSNASKKEVDEFIDDGRGLIIKKRIELIESLLKSITSNSGKQLHPCDGLIFIEDEVSVTFGVSWRILKWKIPNMCTIDFLFRIPKAELTCEFFIRTRRGIELYRIQSLRDTFSSGQNPQDYNGKIVECYHADGDWHAKLIRHDKNVPNYITTVEDTIQSIKDNITIHDLYKTILS